MKKYRKRIADNILVRKLEGKGAVRIDWISCSCGYERDYAFGDWTLYMADDETNEFV